MGVLSSPLNFFKKQISEYAKHYLQRYVKDYGRIEDLQIDFMLKRLILDLQLNGESEPLKVVIEGISSHREKGLDYLVFEKVLVSKIWINDLAKNYLPKFFPGNRIEIDSKIGYLLRKVI